MKLALITLSCAHNYGAVLQTYALSQYLISLGHRVEVIDYITERYNMDAPDFVCRSTRRWSRNAFTVLLWKLSRHQWELKSRDIFRAFLQQHVQMSRRYFSNRELKADPPVADAFLTGSDQIWNSDFSWDQKIDLPYFLDFASDNIPKIAYASSFGKEKLNTAENDDVLTRLIRFKALGVREESGRKIIEELGLQATVVADPTLLCDRACWASIAAPRKVQTPYLLLFQIFPDRELMKLADQIAAKRKLKVVIVSPNYLDMKKIHRKVDYLPTVEQWISYFEYADFVLTDSFHATSFSLIFHKQFLTSTRAKYDSRILGFLKQLGIENRAIHEFTDPDIHRLADEEIDFHLVDEKYKKFVANSAEWLCTQLSS